MKPIVAIFVSHYLPGYKAGGALRSIANLVDRLGDEIDFRILTSDRDLGGEYPYEDIPTMCWQTVGKAQVIYLTPRPSLAGIAALLNEARPDAIYLNSFFDFRYTILPLLARRLGSLRQKWPVILAPRGEFSDGALELKTFKKRLFLAGIRPTGLYQDILWQASTKYEANDIRSVMGDVEIMCAVDLPRRLEAPLSLIPRQPSDPLRIAFLSRLSPMKNLLFALNILAKVRAHVIFTIYGPREDEDYWQRCSTAITILPSHVEVVEAGPLHPTEVVPTLARHDLFFLPTLGENYGHVLVEALEAGLPLLTSDQTPWRNLAEAGVGYDLSLDDPDAFVSAIETEAATIRTEEDGQNIRRYLDRTLRVDETMEENLELFMHALGRR